MRSWCSHCMRTCIVQVEGLFLVCHNCGKVFVSGEDHTMGVKFFRTRCGQGINFFRTRCGQSKRVMAGFEHPGSDTWDHSDGYSSEASSDSVDSENVADDEEEEVEEDHIHNNGKDGEGETGGCREELRRNHDKPNNGLLDLIWCTHCARSCAIGSGTCISCNYCGKVLG